MAPILEEEEKYVRLSLLLKGVATRAVRTYFDRLFPPTYISSTLNTNYNTLDDLKFKRVLTQTQWNLLFPTNGMLYMIDKGYVLFAYKTAPMTASNNNHQPNKHRMCDYFLAKISFKPIAGPS